MPLGQPRPDLASLDLLQSVAELGSIRQAALAHGTSQPAASMRLRSLERALGLRLLDRSSGGATLTPLGQAVAEWSQPVLEGMRALMSGAQALRAETRTQLRLAASMTVAEYLIPKWLARLRAVDPSLSVSLQMGNSAQVAELVARHRVDLGFLESASPLDNLATRDVASDDLVVVVGRDHPWARRRRPLTPRQLAATPLVVREVGSGTREVLQAALSTLGLAVVPAVELGSTTAIKAAVESGTGPAVLSRLAVQGDVSEGRLVTVAVEGLRLGRHIRAVWSPGRPLSGPAESLLAQIEGGPPARR